MTRETLKRARELERHITSINEMLENFLLFRDFEIILASSISLKISDEKFNEELKCFLEKKKEELEKEFAEL